MRGTVAGLDVYPPDPERDGAWRREMVAVGYRLLEQVDDALLDAGLDGHAKHWAIFAATDPADLRLSVRPRASAPPTPEREPATVAGPYDATYENVEGALELAPDARMPSSTSGSPTGAGARLRATAARRYS